MGSSGSWLDEGDLLGVPRRYVVCAAAVCAVKLLMAASLYLLLDVGSTDSFWMDAGRVAPLVQNEVLVSGAVEAPRWAYLFLGWDSAWYASVASYGYQFSDQSFASVPVLPLLARLLQPILGGILPSLAIVSFLAGVLWVPVFESVAEHYVDRREAFVGALLFAFSPFTLLFTTVAYTEGLYLLVTLAAWRLFLGKMYLPAALVAGLSALVRLPGFLIVIPMAVGLLSSRLEGDRRRGVLICLPTAVAMLLWVGFMWLSTGDPIALLHNTEWSGMYTLPTWLVSVLPSIPGAFAFPVPFIDAHPLLPAAIWASITLPPLLAWGLWRIDRRLAVYSVSYLAGVLAFGAVISMPRFAAALFPLWLPVIVKKRGTWIPATLMTVSVVLSLVLWAGFIGGVFVG